MSGELDFEELDAAVNELIRQEKVSEAVEKKSQKSEKESEKMSEKTADNFAKKSPKKTIFSPKTAPKTQPNFAKKSPRLMDFAPRKTQKSTAQNAATQNSPFFAKNTQINSKKSAAENIDEFSNNSTENIARNKVRFMDMIAPRKTAQQQISAKNSAKIPGEEKKISEISSQKNPISTEKSAKENSNSLGNKKTFAASFAFSENNAKTSRSEADFAREIARAFESNSEKSIEPNLDAIDELEQITNETIDDFSDAKKSDNFATKSSFFDDSEEKSEAQSSPFLKNVFIEKLPLGSMPPTSLPADDGGRGKLEAEIPAKNSDKEIDVDVELTTIEDFAPENSGAKVEKNPEKLSESEFINEFLANIKAKTDEINAVAKEILRESENIENQENPAEDTDSNQISENFTNDFQKDQLNSTKKITDFRENIVSNDFKKTTLRDAKKSPEIAKVNAEKTPKIFAKMPPDHLPRKNHSHQWPKRQNFAAVKSVRRSENFSAKKPIANLTKNTISRPAKMHKVWRIFGWIVLYLALISAGGAVGILIYLNGWI